MKVAGFAGTWFLYSFAAVGAATVTRHGVTIEYEPALVSEAFCHEKAAKPRPRNQPPRIERDFTPAELTFVLRSRLQIGSVHLSLSPTTHRSVDYFNQAYPDLAPNLRRLRQLLRDRPRLPELDERRRPIDPLSQHPVYLISKVRYFDFPWGSAIGFLQFDAQDAGNPAGFDPGLDLSRLSYLIYGLTADERFHVTGSLDVVHPKVERRESKRLLANRSLSDDQYGAYLDRATRLMEQGTDESFSPPLTVLHKVMASVAIDATKARPEKWHRFRNRHKITLDVNEVRTGGANLESIAPAQAAN